MAANRTIPTLTVSDIGRLTPSELRWTNDSSPVYSVDNTHVLSTRMNQPKQQETEIEQVFVQTKEEKLWHGNSFWCCLMRALRYRLFQRYNICALLRRLCETWFPHTMSKTFITVN